MIPPIVHVASGREWRGGQRQVWLLARELQGRGLDQVVVTSAGSELVRRLARSGVRVVPAAWRMGLDPRVLPRIWGQLRRHALLHAHDAHALTLAGLCAWPKRSPLVVTRRVTFPLRRRLLWNRACRIIAISSAVRDALIQDGIPASRLVVIPSAVDPAASESGREDLRTRLGLPATGQLVITLGALTPEKDHSTLVLAAARLVQDLPDVHWIIVGDGPLRRDLEQQIAGLGIGHRVHLSASVDDPHQALAGADLFVLSSTSEGLGSSVLAAMACGVPVVATRVGGIPELVGTEGGLLVAPRSPAELADGMRLVLGDAALRRRLAEAGRNAVGRFSVRDMAEQVLSVYRSCAHSLEGS